MTKKIFSNEKTNHGKYDYYSIGKVYLDIDGNQHMADVVIGKRANGDAVIYDLTRLNKIEDGLVYSLTTVGNDNPSLTAATTVTASMANISQSESNVNENIPDGVDKKYHYDTCVDKMKTAGMIEDVLKASVECVNEKPRHSNFTNFARGKAVFYDLVDIKKLRNGYKYHLLTVAPHSSTAATTVTVSGTSISQSESNVNENVSESSDKKPQFSIDKKHPDWDVCLTKEEQAMFCRKIGEIKQGKAAQFPESSLSRLRRQLEKETEVRMLVVNNKIIYTDGDYINPQINDVYIFEIGLNPDEQNVNEIYYMVELAMEDFIYYEEISKFGRVYQTCSNDTGRNKEIFEAMCTLDKKTKTQVDRGRIRIRRKRGPGETNNRVISETGGSGTIQRSAVRISGTESESDTRTDNSRGKQNSGRNEERAGEGVSGGKKPQLSIDEHGLYSRSSSSLTPRVLLSTMTDGDIESLSQAETAALTEYQDALRLYNAFDEKRAAARMRLNALKAESNQTSDIKEHIKRTQDTLKRMNAKLKETDTKLQEMEQSNFPNFARGNVYLSIGNKQ